MSAATNGRRFTFPTATTPEAAGREDDMFGGDATPADAKPAEKPADPGDRNLDRVDVNAMSELLADTA